MEKSTIIQAFVQLGELMRQAGNENVNSQFWNEEDYNMLKDNMKQQFIKNGWFTFSNVQKALQSLGEELNLKNIEDWLRNYSYAENPKKIGIIMAGNIPVVGFHDMLCVLLSGNIAVCKLSSDDASMIPFLMEKLMVKFPELATRFEFSTGKLGKVDAVIATGSNNSMRYFDQYFGHMPHLFRKNRTSIAILDGDESEAELNGLGLDIFDYFGLGCRNVSHLLLPKGYEMDRFFKGVLNQHEVIQNKKYGNNYDYNKAIYLMNQLPLFDNNFVLLHETRELHSPLAMIYYHFYESEQDIQDYLTAYKEEIQCVVGKNHLPFGTAQKPGLSSYADGVDTMLFLNNLG